jgi:hypothetical protein
LEKTDLAVGDSTYVEIIFNTQRSSGPVTKRPKIETNEGEPAKNVAIKANVAIRPDSTYPIIIKPYKINISQFGETKRDQMKFTITNVSDKDLPVTLVSWPWQYLAEVKLPKKIEAGKTGEGVVILRSDKLEDSFEKSFTLELGDDAKTRFTVPVTRTVKSPSQQDSAATTTGETESAH